MLRSPKLLGYIADQATKQGNTPIYGFRSIDQMLFRSVGAKGEEVFFSEDKDITLKETLADHPVSAFKASHVGIRSQWVAIEGVSAAARKDFLDMSGNYFAVKRNLTEKTKNYYMELCSAILGRDSEEIQVAISELSVSPYVSHILPHLVNFVTTSSSNLIVSCPDTPVNTDTLVDMVRVIAALTENNAVSIHPYVLDLIAVCKRCATDAAIVSSSSCIHDHWILRERAASATARLIGRNGLLESDVCEQLLMSYQELLAASTSQLACLYGAISGIAAFGLPAVGKYLIPCTGTLVSCTEAHLGGIAELDAIMVQGALKVAVGQVLKSGLWSVDQPAVATVLSKSTCRVLLDADDEICGSQLNSEAVLNLLGDSLTLHEVPSYETCVMTTPMSNLCSDECHEIEETADGTMWESADFCEKPTLLLQEDQGKQMDDISVESHTVLCHDQERDPVQFKMKPSMLYLTQSVGWKQAKHVHRI
ncbi:uncharacterized protein LOC134179501 isoform X2 [Corticium candelabrum]|uniref:uncharacterized protein LOC134179501 isoform X2 n=1 Tax=Corticium candelabrum TaxID=121492 RepID=UPI002E25874D|nr:uncharacterized protein LOC134179501 isoform X2 [Corticium candelabrum]